VLIILGCAGLAAITLWLDTLYTDDIDASSFLLASTVAGGRSIVTTVAGATMTVSAIVFSITALSSQIAANQYSPRAVSGFFEDSFQQLVIGLIVGTFTYCLLVLGSLSSSIAGAADPTPSIAITLAVVLGVASAIGIVGYIDHSLRRFQVDSVVRRIARATVAALERNHSSEGTIEVDQGSTSLPETSAVIKADMSGWVQVIDARTLARSLPSDTIARVAVRLGEPISKGDHLMTIWPDPGDQDGIHRTIRRSIRAGRDRSLDNDPSFGIRQLVDIALKALSPGINDPTTAVDVLHHLKVPIRKMLEAEAPRRVFQGPSGQRVYLAETPSRSQSVHAAFAEIRLASTGQPSVMAALLEVLGDLESELEGSEMAGRASAIKEEIALTVEMVSESDLPEPDRQRVLGERKRAD
jgi:uncharacterized membrane protein